MDPCLRQVMERKFYRYYSSHLFCLVTVLLLDRTVFFFLTDGVGALGEFWKWMAVVEWRSGLF